MRPQLEKALLEATSAHPWIAKFKVDTREAYDIYMRTHSEPYHCVMALCL
jgi:hypothetical protein